MSDLKAIIIVVLIILLIAGIDKNVGPPQENIEPYTGLCTDPTTQGGC